MNGWVKVGTRSELLPGEYRLVWDGDTPIAVYNIDGALYAVEDVCTHDGGELAGGEVSGFEVECPRHGARFDLRSGAATRLPAHVPVASFPVCEEDGLIWTRDDR
ncbi:MAG: non-heme iron oxygenase ferredoxin subunit [Xanthomonadaceae bacterium]|jgi:3-phenylpropionate/trans-cinnamate dioxygenase ferredoxin subunit|nr:non-heme iron oxygenase ferredoxin subunit [Xanthomonadaceae bacterium]